jgi:hypothetical protein
MTRTGQDAINYARAQVGPNSMGEPGMCLKFTRQCFAVPSLYASAVDAGYAVNAKHPDDWHPPPAVPVWFRSPSVYDHVCFFVSENEVISTWNADVRVYSSLRDVELKFGDSNGPAEYVGWGEDVNEVTVWTPQAPPEPEPEPVPEVIDVTTIIRFVDTGAITYLSDSGVVTAAATPEEVHAMAAALRLPSSWVDLDSFQWTRVHQAAERIRQAHRDAGLLP